MIEAAAEKGTLGLTGNGTRLGLKMNHLNEPSSSFVSNVFTLYAVSLGIVVPSKI